MTDPAPRRHGLEMLLSGKSADPGGAGFCVRIRHDVGYLNVRGRAEDAEFVAVVENALGQTLPISPNSTSTDRHEICWLGPDEWLVVTGLDDLAGTWKDLHEALSSHTSALVDVTGGYIKLELAGGDIRRILAKGCTLDLHPVAFAVGDCAQTELAKANVLVSLVADTPVFQVTVRRSFSDYILRWLLHSAGSGGTRLSDV